EWVRGVGMVVFWRLWLSIAILSQRKWRIVGKIRVISDPRVNGRYPISAAAAVTGMSPAEIKELKPARLPLHGKAVVASRHSLLPKTASPAEAKIGRYIQLDGGNLKGKIDQRMQ